MEVRGAEAFDGAPREPLPATVLDQVRSVPGVSHAAGMVEGYAEVVDPDGDEIGSPTMATIGGSADGIGTVSPFELRSGRVPAGADEVAVDASTARTYGLAVGDRVTVVFAGPARQFTMVGTVGMGRIDDVANTTYALFDLPTAQAVLGRPGQVDEVLVSAAPGISPAELVRADLVRRRRRRRRGDDRRAGGRAVGRRRPTTWPRSTPR